MAIFGKDPVSQKPSEQPDPSAAPRRVAYVGPNLTFDGELTGSEGLIVDGEVRGEIRLESDLRIGKTGRVEARVHAANVIVEGTLLGDLSADSRVELISTANVEGNITAPKIVVAEGARFRGAVDMKAPDSRAKPEKPAEPDEPGAKERVEEKPHATKRS